MSELSGFIKNAKEDDLRLLLRSLLTRAEIEALVQRLGILDGLARGTPQREISESLRVGIATVTRGSRVWQSENDLLRRYFPRPKEG
ncbi:transcriptional regulator [bacterium]|nr:transcriptional regulator [bacterium]